jgi:hypothetical protein
MIVINTVNSKLFSLNGVNYVKNFLSFVAGDKVCIYNAYDRNDERIKPTIYTDFTVNGTAYGSATALQAALIGVIYTRDSLGGQIIGVQDAINDGELDLAPSQNAVFDALALKSDKTDTDSPDIITTIGTVNQTGANITIDALAFAWRIAQVNYTNTLQYTTTIASATEGFNRIDILVANTSNGFTKIQGVESADVAVKPSVPANALEAAFINVYGAVISTPQPAINGSEYVAKNELSAKKLYGTGNKAAFTMVDEVATFRIMEATSIASVTIAASDKKVLYSGKDHYIKNETGTVLIINHNSGTGNYKYFFPNAANLTIQNNEIVHFKFRFANGNNGFLDYVGVAGGTTDISGKQNTLLSGTNIRTVNGQSLLGSTDLVISSTSGQTYYKSVAHLGNSLTIHEITSFWWGTWGMAATIRDNDYVHRFESILKGYYPSLVSTPLSVKPWELNYATYDKSLMDASLVGKDLVIVRLGENVAYYADFQNQYKILIQYIQSKVPTARIILGGQFWAETTKENAMIAVGVELGLTYVNLNYLDVAANKSSLGTQVYGDDNQWHAIDNSGVAAHPNDTGMLKIAETLFGALGYKNNTITQITPITILAANWVFVSGFYEYNFANANITSKSVVEIIPENASVSIIKTAEILPKTISGNGTVKLYSTNLPTGNITATLNIIK